MHVKESRWQRLDNTATVFPVIANNSTTNVYRITASLNENIDGRLLQEALDRVLPRIPAFNVRLKKGLFWYYLESNHNKPPLVREENSYPCRFIDPKANNGFLFRVSYYQDRINLEVFHVLGDGMGGFNFLKELAYQYIRLAHIDKFSETGDSLDVDTSLSTEDSFVKNYKHAEPNDYKSGRAVTVKGEKLLSGALGVMSGHMKVDQLKEASKALDLSINEYLVSALAFAIYKGFLNGASSVYPISINVPVNLRPFFDSVTTRNFFVMVSAVFTPEKEKYNFEEVCNIIRDSLRKQITKEHLEKLFSYNVSNQKNIILRVVPFFIKKYALRLVYMKGAKANTTTFTNLGVVKVNESYKQYIREFNAMIPPSAGQQIKAGVTSYNGVSTVTFTSVFRDTSIQKEFFQLLASHGIDVTIETNGLFYH
jgi:NRPS condensation-like uncharacterized protein